MIIVDNRETKKRKYKAEKVFKEIKIEQLDSGDYVYDNIAIELKTADDYINSIKNKRLFKQVIKMAETYDYHYVIVYGNMQTAINKTRYHGKYFSVNQFIGSLNGNTLTNSPFQIGDDNELNFNSDNYLKILDELKTEIQNLKLTNKQSDELKRLVKEAEDACVNRKDSTFKKVLKQIWDFAKATGSGLLVAYLSVKFGLTN